jgi:hypothetical protein
MLVPLLHRIWQLPSGMFSSAETKTPPEQLRGQAILVVVADNFLHEHRDPAPEGGTINSHERSYQP